VNPIAEKLNRLSDELGRTIDNYEKDIQQLNLGIELWLGRKAYNLRLGYAKVNSVWGLYVEELGVGHSQRWRLKEAPREHRVMLVPTIPELIKSLLEKADEMSTKIESCLNELKHRK
jgi:hypothetical protein